jgi:hypothetical protein
VGEHAAGCLVAKLGACSCGQRGPDVVGEGFLPATQQQTTVASIAAHSINLLELIRKSWETHPYVESGTDYETIRLAAAAIIGKLVMDGLR